MAILDAYRHVFPVVAGAGSADGQVFVVEQVLGTAFPIGGDFWLTAAHVLLSANGLGFVRDNRWHGVFIGRQETVDSHDIGVFEAKEIQGTPVSWHESELAMSEQVLSVGFPYALSHELATVSIRAFRGNVVAAVTTTKIPARPRAYELQFQCPRGLSGAPLLYEHSALHVAGVIIGNATTEMLVLSDREVLKDGSTSIIERYEMLQLGIAIQAFEILPLQFRMLGGTIRQHLTSHRLIW